VDLYKAIRQLVDEKKRIDRIIASLEAMADKGTTAAPRKAIAKTAVARRRGRKGMSPDERREVSERMARYWAAKRLERIAAPAKAATDGPEPGPDSPDS
jgi:hypothetical protein